MFINVNHRIKFSSLYFSIKYPIITSKSFLNVCTAKIKFYNLFIRAYNKRENVESIKETSEKTENELPINKKSNIVTNRQKIKEQLKNKENIVKKQIKSSGPGGQHVNKANTCSYLQEKKTGVSVKVSQSRDSFVNKAIAEKRLLDKIDLHYNGAESKIGKKIEKIQKQKMNRQKKSSEKYNSNNNKNNIKK